MCQSFLCSAVMGVGLSVIGLACSETLPPPPPSSQPTIGPQPVAVSPPVSVPPSTATTPVKKALLVEGGGAPVAVRPESPAAASLSKRLGRFLGGIKELRREPPERRVAEVERRLQELLTAYPENQLARVQILTHAADVFHFLDPDPRLKRELQLREEVALLAKAIALEGVVLEQRSQYQLADCLNTNGKKDAAKAILQALVEFKYFDSRWEPRTEELKAIYRDAAILLLLITPLEEVHRLRFVMFVMTEIEDVYPEQFRRMPKAFYLPGSAEFDRNARAVVETHLLESPEGSELRKHLEATLKHLLESKR